MRELIITDLRRMFKDKLLLIACIIGAAFSLISPLLYQLLFGLLDMGDMLGLIVNAKTQYFESFSPANNFGMIAPVFIAVIICKDFSYGTVRNKIISGHSRTEIYFSILVSSAVVLTAVMLAHALLTLLFSLVFFEYQAEPFGVNDLLYFLLSTLFEILVCILIAATVSFLAAITKNIGLSIVGFFGINFLFLIVGSITMVAVQFADPDDILHGVLECINDANVFTSTVIGHGTTYDLREILCILVPTVGGTALLSLFGNILFGKKDLK